MDDYLELKMEKARKLGGGGGAVAEWSKVSKTLQS